MMVRDRIHRDRISFSYVFIYSYLFHHRLHVSHQSSEKNKENSVKQV